jgi:hypothetical protein
MKTLSFEECDIVSKCLLLVERNEGIHRIFEYLRMKAMEDVFEFRLRGIRGRFCIFRTILMFLGLVPRIGLLTVPILSVDFGAVFGRG